MGDFPAFGKIPRLHRDVVITEKIDGTNGLVFVTEQANSITYSGEAAGFLYHVEDGTCIAAGSRNRWLKPSDDNFGFCEWVYANADELVKLGPGHHYGEWWGKGINRGYGASLRMWSLFNVTKWGDSAVRPSCCDVVPVLAKGSGALLNGHVSNALDMLRLQGSYAWPGFKNPEGLVVYHEAANQLFKVTLENDEAPKTLAKSDLVLAA